MLPLHHGSVFDFSGANVQLFLVSASGFAKKNSIFEKNKETMLVVDFNSFNINHLTITSDFEKKVIFFCEDWSSTSKTLSVQTSGSTGTPKKMEIEKSKMAFSANATCDFLQLKEKCTALLVLPIDYIAGKMMVVRAMEKKMKLHVVSPSLNPLSQLTVPIDFCALTPLQVENSLDKLYLIKNLIIGGAAVSENLKIKIQNTLSQHSENRVFETFGMTETLSHIALKEISPKNEDFFTAFDGIYLSKDHRDCLTIIAPNLCNDILQTNDVVEFVSENQFKFLGRADFIINSGGAKIHPEDLEKKLKTILEIELVFIGLKDDYLGEKLVLVLEKSTVNSEEQQIFIDAVVQFPFEKSFHQPKEIFFVEKLPRTENGKINRNALKQLIENKK